MALAYGITALIALCMVGICVWADKKKDVWLILLFVSVSMCNLGYYMLSISKDLDAALNSNRIAYLGSVFLPFFLLMMVLRFCGLRRSKVMTVSLAAIGILMLAITTSPGILPIYYRTVDIAFVDGGTKLIRTYGPCHMLYYVYLIGYMLSMIGIALYSVAKKKIKSRQHTILLLCAVFCNITIWLVEQFLPRGFEWLSVSYILTEGLILAIYQSMQKQGLMDREKRTPSYTIHVLLSVYLLLFANFVRVVTKATTPTMYVVAQVVILIIYVGILVAWAASVYDRIINRAVRRYLLVLVGLMMFWMLMRTLRLTVFYHVFPLGQWCWYAYYISMILIPQICLFAARYIGKPEEYRLSRKWYFMYIPSLLLVVGILTNDLHQQAFRFHMGYAAGWDTYQRLWLYYVVVVWIFGCISMMIAEVIRRCRIPGTRKTIWMPIAMLAVGVAYAILYTVDSDLFGFIEMTAALCFTVVAIWESCIKTGLVPSNTHYDELLACFGLGVTVIDNDYTEHYRSDALQSYSAQQLRQATEAPVMLEGGIRLSGAKIRGGYTLWQEDLSELTELLGELEELRGELTDANTLSMQNYQMDRRIRALAEKNRLHDELHRQTAHQIGLLNDWLARLIETEDPDEKQNLLRRIIVVGAYLKRRNNLALVHEQEGVIRAEELELSIREMMKNLQLAGVSCAAVVQFAQEIPSHVVLQLFDFYEYVVEQSFDGLSSLLARFFRRGGSIYCCVDAVCSLDLRALQSDKISVSVSDENTYTISFKAEGGDGR